MSLHIPERPVTCLCIYLQGLWHVSAHTWEAHDMYLHIPARPMACLCIYLWGLWHVSAYTCEAYGMSLHIPVRPMACLCTYLWGLWHVSAHTWGLWHDSAHSCEAYGMSLHIPEVYGMTLQIPVRPMACLCTYEGCPKNKWTVFLFKCLLDSPEITSYVLQSVTLGKLHSGSNVFSTHQSSAGSHFPLSVCRSTVKIFFMFSIVPKWWPFNFDFKLGKR